MEKRRYFNHGGTEARRKAPITRRQICWETAKTSPGKFTSVNFASERHNLGFTFMNLLSVAEKNFPQSEPDVAQDFFSLRKLFAGKTWKFTEGRNLLNPASHAAETASSPVAFAGIGRTTPNFGLSFGVGTFKANSCPL